MKMFLAIKEKWLLFARKIRQQFDDTDEVFYIGGGDVLPPPLEKGQENMCIIALSSKNSSDSKYPRDEARAQLI